MKFDAFLDNKVPFGERSTSGSCSTLSLTAFDSHSNCTRISIEDFVKLVVSAVKEGGLLLTHKGDRTETPEEILRRKRAQVSSGCIDFSGNNYMSLEFVTGLVIRDAYDLITASRVERNERNL